MQQLGEHLKERTKDVYSNSLQKGVFLGLIIRKRDTVAKRWYAHVFNLLTASTQANTRSCMYHKQTGTRLLFNVIERKYRKHFISFFGHIAVRAYLRYQSTTNARTLERVFRFTMFQNFATLTYASLSYLVDRFNAQLLVYAFHRWASEALQRTYLDAMLEYIYQKKNRPALASQAAKAAAGVPEFTSYYEYGAKANALRSTMLPKVAIGGDYSARRAADDYYWHFCSRASKEYFFMQDAVNPVLIAKI
eukprot:Selendium_serpulae@DN2649_c0_g1_i1.p1